MLLLNTCPLPYFLSHSSHLTIFLSSRESAPERQIDITNWLLGISTWISHWNFILRLNPSKSDGLICNPHLKASFFKLWIFVNGFTMCTISKARNLYLIFDYSLSLSHSLHLLSHHFWFILPSKCFLHHLMSIPYHFPVFSHYLLSWITPISFLKVSLPLLPPP